MHTPPPLLVQKIKASLHPELAHKSPAADVMDPEDSLAGRDELEPWERYVAAALIENERTRPEFFDRAARNRQEVRAAGAAASRRQ
jgi:hypothetical protein